MPKLTWQAGIAGAILGVATLAGPALAADAGTTGATGVSGAIGASGTTGATGASGATGSKDVTGPKGASFLQAKLRLEAGLATRRGQLDKLSAAVGAAVNLTVSDKTALSGRLATEVANIAALIAKVPGDSTWAQLRADSIAMLRDNRVFLVMTPQVRDSIEADNDIAFAASMQANEAALSAAITARASDAGYGAAMRAFTQEVRLLARVHTSAAKIDATVLAQAPAGYPRNQRVFNRARTALASQARALETTSADATAIQLFVEADPAA